MPALTEENLEIFNRVYARRCILDIERSIQEALEQNFPGSADSAGSIKEVVREQLETFVASDMIQKEPKVEAQEVERDWDYWYPSYGKKWLALVTELLEEYGICKPFSRMSRGKENLNTGFKWYHFVLPYIRKTYTFIPWEVMPDPDTMTIDDIQRWVENNTFICSKAHLQRPDKIVEASVWIKPVTSLDRIEMTITVDRNGVTL